MKNPDIMWDSQSDVWSLGVPDECSETGWSYGVGRTLAGAFADITAYLGYEPTV
jgi:hypothetical protein